MTLGRGVLQSIAHRTLSGAALAAVVLLTAAPLTADDWPQFRGPARDGKSAETGLLQEWPEGGPPLAWKASGIGGGFSSLAVVGERIYTLGDLEDGQYALGLSSQDGSILWKTLLGPRHQDKYPGPRSTPTVDGDRLYVISTEGVVACLEAATGEEVWRRSLPDDFQGYMMKAMGSYEWKFAESPLVETDKVIVTPGHIEAVLVALDKTTGKEIWRTEGGRIGPLGSDGAAYASAVVSEAAGVRQVVQFVGRGIIGVDAATGKMLWGYNRVANDIANISTPLLIGNRIFASSGYGTGSALIEIGKGEEGLAATEVYFLGPEVMQNHHGGLILHDGIVYTGTAHNKGFPVAVKLDSGEVAWGPERNAGQGSAAITYADGRLYFRYQDGRMILVGATPEAYREHGTFEIPDVEYPSWTFPVISGGKLFLREQGTLYVYDVKQPS